MRKFNELRDALVTAIDKMCNAITEWFEGLMK